MCKKLFYFIALLCCCVGGIILFKYSQLNDRHLSLQSTNNYDLESTNILNTIPTVIPQTTESDQYYKSFNVSATEQMPDLSFELTGKSERDDYNYISLLV